MCDRKGRKLVWVIFSRIRHRVGALAGPCDHSSHFTTLPRHTPVIDAQQVREIVDPISTTFLHFWSRRTESLQKYDTVSATAYNDSKSWPDSILGTFDLLRFIFGHNMLRIEVLILQSFRPFATYGSAQVVSYPMYFGKATDQRLRRVDLVWRSIVVVVIVDSLQR